MRGQVVERRQQRRPAPRPSPSATTWLSTSTPSACAQEARWRPRRARPGPRSPGRWPAPGSAGPRRSRTSACRPGRRDRAAAGSAARCGPGRPARSSSTGSADITVSHLGHSVLPIWIATGPPRVSPCRTPPRMVTSSCLELHPGAAAEAEPAPGERVGDVGGGHRDVRRQPFQDRDQRGAVGLPRGQPSEHDRQSFTRDRPIDVPACVRRSRRRAATGCRPVRTGRSSARSAAVPGRPAGRAR